MSKTSAAGSGSITIDPSKIYIIFLSCGSYGGDIELYIINGELTEYKNQGDSMLSYTYSNNILSYNGVGGYYPYIYTAILE